MAKFHTEHAIKDGWTRWVQPIRKGYKFVCCDCGLVHNMDFRVQKGRAQFRAQRNNRSTALTRRHRAALEQKPDKVDQWNRLSQT